MTWCEYTDKCELYKRDEEALDKIENKHGKDNLAYKIVFAKLNEMCNHRHLFCSERLKLKEN